MSVLLALVAAVMMVGVSAPAGAVGARAGVAAAVNASSEVSITGNDQAQAFVQAVGTPNAVVRIAGYVDLNLSGLQYVHVAPGVQIIGDRSMYPLGPRLFTTTFPSVLLMIGDDGAGTTSDNVRISGIRLDGGQGNDSADSDTPDADGIKVNSSQNIEIDHNEIYGWRGAAITVSDVQNRIDVNNPHTVWVHDNYIHHNQHVTGEIIGGGHGAGYGVETSYGAYAYIQRNVFNFNRHAITGDGRDGTGYFVYDNLILPDGGDNTEVIHTHIIDMHGRNDCGVSTYNCGPAGETMMLYYNTVEYTAGTAVKLRGVPSDGMYAVNNIFAHEDVWGGTLSTGAFEQTVGDNGQYIHQSGNTFGLDTYDQAHKSCDFDGDGTPDQFLATGITWWYASSRLSGRWTYLTRSAKLAPDVTLADVNGDGLCDATDNNGTVVTSSPDVVSGKITADARTDIALVGQYGSNSIPVAASQGDGTFSVTNAGVGVFAEWAQVPGVRRVSGDFNGDGRTDIALIPGPDTSWWTSLPVAFSNGDGTFRITNAPRGDFAGWAQTPGARPVAGDFNHDGRTDIALIPGPNTSWWTSLPVAFSQGDGTFGVTNAGVGDYSQWAQVPGAKPVAGDFNGDGRTDIALIPGPNTSWWTSLPVAFSQGDGTFGITAVGVGDYSQWAQVPGVRPVAGDFNGDGRTDISLIPGPGTSWWTTLPTAFSQGDGSFRITNTGVGDYVLWGQTPGARPVAGDFNGDGRTDIALSAGPGTSWTSLPVAFSQGDGTFSITNAYVGDYSLWAATPGARPVAGDFNNDGRTDIALTGAAGWASIPVAFSQGNGAFSITNSTASDFATWVAP
jgi:hypothetical protein